MTLLYLTDHRRNKGRAAGLGQNGGAAARAATVAPAPVVSRLRRVAYGARSFAVVSKTSSAASVASEDDSRGWLESTAVEASGGCTPARSGSSGTGEIVHGDLQKGENRKRRSWISYIGHQFTHGVQGSIELADLIVAGFGS